MHETNLPRADLNLLVVFDAVARTRSVTLAAERLSLSQPAVSHALNRLRTLTRDPLFVRGRDGLVLTPRADVMVVPVSDILAAIARIVVAPEFSPADTVRRFKVGASDYSMMTVVPGLVRAVRAQAPSGSLEIVQFGANVLALLESGELDMAFWGATAPPSPFLSAELFREHFVGLVCARHPLAIKAEQGGVALNEYMSFPHVIVTFLDSRQNPVDARLAELGLKRKIGLVSPSFAANAACLHGSDLIMSAPSRFAANARQSGLVSFKLPFNVPDYPYSVVWHRKTDEDPAVRWLRDLAIQADRPHAM